MNDGLLLEPSQRGARIRFPARHKSFLLFVLPKDDEDIVDTILQTTYNRRIVVARQLLIHSDLDNAYLTGTYYLGTPSRCRVRDRSEAGSV